MLWWLERCSAPKTASGVAKHKCLRATILSMARLGNIVPRGQQPDREQRDASDGHRQGGARQFREYRKNARLHGPPELAEAPEILRRSGLQDHSRTMSGHMDKLPGPKPAWTQLRLSMQSSR